MGQPIEPIIGSSSISELGVPLSTSRPAGSGGVPPERAAEVSVSPERLDAAVSKLNGLAKKAETSLRFYVKPNDGIVVQVVDEITKRVVATIPPWETVQAAETADEPLGLLLNRKV